MSSLEIGKSGRFGGQLQLRPAGRREGRRASRDERVPLTDPAYNAFATRWFWLLFAAAAVAHAAGLW